MTAEVFYRELKKRFIEVLRSNNIENEPVEIICRSLTPEEAIGKTKRQDFPIITGTDVMIQAEFRGCFGQAFTEAPTAFEGTLTEILEMDIVGDVHARSLFIAVMNAVMNALNLCKGTVHCRADGPEYCAQDMLAFLQANYRDRQNIALIGFQPALLEMLSKSEFNVRVLDLNPANIGKMKYGVPVEDGHDAYHEVTHEYADLILCTGSTVCNGTIVDYLELDTEVVFFGTTLSGAAEIMGLKRSCFADKYE